MRFHHAESMTNIDYYVPMAQAAESMGYAGVVIPDSLVYPKESHEKYHYTSDGGREFLENKPFLESFIHATAVGVATKTLEMTFNVVKLPVRPPFSRLVLGLASTGVETRVTFTAIAKVSAIKTDAGTALLIRLAAFPGITLAFEDKMLAPMTLFTSHATTAAN